jgi:hypothetical protein
MTHLFIACLELHLTTHLFACLGMHVGLIYDLIISTSSNLDLHVALSLVIAICIKVTSDLIYPLVVYMFLAIWSLMKLSFPMLVFDTPLKSFFYLHPHQPRVHQI